MIKLLSAIFPELELLEIARTGRQLLADDAAPARPPAPQTAPPNAVGKHASSADDPNEKAVRDGAWSEGMGKLSALVGAGIREVERLFSEMKNTQFFGNGTVFVISGERGTGKSTLSDILPLLAFGSGLSGTASTVHLSTGRIPSDIRADIWVADDFDDFFSSEKDANEIGLQFQIANRRRKVVLVLLGSPDLPRLLEDNAMKWLGKSAVHLVRLPALDDDELVEVGRRLIERSGLAINDAALSSLRKRIQMERGQRLPTSPVTQQGFDGMGTILRLLNRASQLAAEQHRPALMSSDFEG